MSYYYLPDSDHHLCPTTIIGKAFATVTRLSRAAKEAYVDFGISVFFNEDVGSDFRVEYHSSSPRSLDSFVSEDSLETFLHAFDSGRVSIPVGMRELIENYFLGFTKFL